MKLRNACEMQLRFFFLLAPRAQFHTLWRNRAREAHHVLIVSYGIRIIIDVLASTQWSTYYPYPFDLKTKWNAAQRRWYNRVKSDPRLIRMKFINQHLPGKSERILFTEISSL